jgi:hypothetical protein
VAALSELGGDQWERSQALRDLQGNQRIQKEETKMSWSTTKQTADREQLKGAKLREDNTYMPEAVGNAIDAAVSAFAPKDGVELEVSTYGHINDDGTGSLRIEVKTVPV